MVKDVENWSKTFITDNNESGAGSDSETKCQSYQWKLQTQPRPKKAQSKIMSTVFFFNYEETAKEYYLEVLKRFRDVVRGKRPQRRLASSSRSCTYAFSEFVQISHSSCLSTIIQSRYSPMFWLFPKLNIPSIDSTVSKKSRKWDEAVSKLAF